ncbi:MAG: hypothetical protein H6625_08170 [Bdellovibrionaceae bacterium]|nr:hypothetical protein [Pseudobdellovibrionaceae bacterium]
MVFRLFVYSFLQFALCFTVNSLKISLAHAYNESGPIYPRVNNCDAQLSSTKTYDPNDSILRLPQYKFMRPTHDGSTYTRVHEEVLDSARKFKLILDFKELADLKPLPLMPKFHGELKKITSQMSEKEKAKYLLNVLFDKPNYFVRTPSYLTHSLWHMPVNAESPHALTFNHTEKMWSSLIRSTQPITTNSLIPLPYPFLVSGERFREQYYWDTFFGIKGLLVTGRLELAQMQVENLLHLVRQYGFVPNGNRTYYLTRSHPPLLSSMVRDVYLATLKSKDYDSVKLHQWLRQTLDLLKMEHSFWMSPKRFDKKTGLNHHWDELNKTRPERWGEDDETQLGKTYRDVRAEAESGADFTDTFEGQSSQVAPILLNSILYKMEMDIAWMAEKLIKNSYQLDNDSNINMKKTIQSFRKAATRRQKSMNRFLWNAELGIYQDYQLSEKRRLPYIKADAAAALYTEVASPTQAISIVDALNRNLVKTGGLVATNVDSHKQWDSPYAWATHQFFYVEGTKKYSQKLDNFEGKQLLMDSKNLAQKWMRAIDTIYLKHNAIYEKINGETGDLPKNEPGKYPNQKGFLWTNSVYVWFLIDSLGIYPDYRPK